MVFCSAIKMMHWYMLETLYQVKEIRHKKLRVVWFNLYEISSIDKFTETESKLMAVSVWGEGKWGVAAKWVWGSFWGDEIV